MRRLACLFLASFSLGWMTPTLRAKEARLLRFPAILGDQVVFGCAGDLVTTTNKTTGTVTVDAEATLTTEYGDVARYTDEQGKDIGGTYGAFLVAPIWAALAPYIQGRIDDSPSKSKRVECFRLPEADNQSKIRFRFGHPGTDNLYFGFDYFGLYAPSADAGRRTPDAGRRTRPDPHRRTRRRGPLPLVAGERQGRRAGDQAVVGRWDVAGCARRDGKQPQGFDPRRRRVLSAHVMERTGRSGSDRRPPEDRLDTGRFNYLRSQRYGREQSLGESTRQCQLVVGYKPRLRISHDPGSELAGVPWLLHHQLVRWDRLSFTVDNLHELPDRDPRRIQ